MTLNIELSWIQHFASLSDPRVERTKQHLLLDIIVIAILAVISGADGWVAIETYGQSKQEWLSTFLSLPNGIPSHDTQCIGYLLGLSHKHLSNASTIGSAH